MFQVEIWSSRRNMAALVLVAAASLFALSCGSAVSEEPKVAGDAQGTVKEAAPSADENPFGSRTKSPELDGGLGWINTGGPIELKDLRGKFVVLDFWTYCCINCMHILPELKKLEQAYPNNVVVIGVHTAKFDTEKDTKNITEAVLRHDIEHPVINDADYKIWRRFGLTGWPGLRVIDPEGYLVAKHGGEIDFESLDAFFKKSLPYYRKRGLLDETPIRFDLEREKIVHGPLHFPGKILTDEASNRMFIADSGHQRIVIASLDGKLIDVIGSGKRGWANGSYSEAMFASPQGMTLHKGMLYLADTENHLVRMIDLEKKQVMTIAGTGKQSRGFSWPGIDRVKEDSTNPQGVKLPDRWVSSPRKLPIASPWAVSVHGEHLYIAMAGRHQIWRMGLDEKEIEVYAGNGREEISDGKLAPKIPPRVSRFGGIEGYSAFAQPSGFATDGEWLYVADSEGSSVRAVPYDAKRTVRTVVGANDEDVRRPLFNFGDKDGKGSEVKLQHALGIAHHQGKLYLSDTYNNKIKVIDLSDSSAKTLVGDKEPGKTDSPARFDEPAGIDYAGGKLYVADTNNHQIRTIDLKTNEVKTLTISGLTPPVEEKPTSALSIGEGGEVQLPSAKLKVVDNQVQLKVEIQLPEGWKMNPLAPMSYQVDPLTEKGPVDRTDLGKSIRVKEADRGPSLTISLPVVAKAGEDRLQVTVRYYYCREGAEGLCKVGSVSWQLPVSLSEQGRSSAILPHKVE